MGMSNTVSVAQTVRPSALAFEMTPRMMCALFAAVTAEEMVRAVQLAVKTFGSLEPAGAQPLVSRKTRSPTAMVWTC